MPEAYTWMGPSIDGVGRTDTKHEGVYLWAPRDMHELERLLEKWLTDYNRLKSHKALSGQTPWEVYQPEDTKPWERAA
jgi:hypothetical protein